MTEAVIVSAVRTAVGKAPKGTLRATRPDDLAPSPSAARWISVPALDQQEIEDVIIGCAMPEGEQGMNVARIAALRAGLPIESAAMTVNRYCASGLQAIALAAERIRGGGAEVIVAGGTESMSMIPFGGNKISVNPWLVRALPGFLPLHGADRRARGAPLRHLAPAGRPVRPRQPHQGPGRAGRRKFEDEIVPVPVTFTAPDAKSKTAPHRSDLPGGRGAARRDLARSAGQAQARLPRQRHRHRGQLLADFRWRRRCRGHVRRTRPRARPEPLARFVSFAYAGCLPEEMGIGPVYAIPKALKLAGLTLDQIDLIELNEAFAASRSR